MKADFWRGRRVLVTGQTGFKGSWLSLWLHRLGAEVRGLALEPPTEPSLFRTGDVAQLMPAGIGDVRDAANVMQLVEAFRPEIVLHLAAQSLVRASYADPVETYGTNVMGTVNVLEACRRCAEVRTVIVVTSDKCYENHGWVWGYREVDALGGHDPYSSSKGCAELVTAAYRRSFLAERGIGVATVRAGNVIGGGDWAKDRLIPDAARAFTVGEPVRLRNPKSVRPWQHVLEPLRGYMELAERLWQSPRELAGAWNFGPALEDARPVDEVIELLARAWGGEARWEALSENGPHEAPVLRLDCSKATVSLGWRPRWTLPMALGRVANWYRAHAEGANARQLVEQDIDAYEEMD